MYLFFDTETTGIPRDYNAPASDTENWPRIVQLGWTLTDASGNELRAQSLIVRPSGFEIPASATRVHGITTETARLHGIDIEAVLTAFSRDLIDAETLVAHNMGFDEPVVSAEYFRAGHGNTPLAEKAQYCTMRSSADFCKIRGQGPYGYKWPRLDELHGRLFDAPLAAAHDALADARTCARCYFELKRRGHISGLEHQTYKRPAAVDLDDYDPTDDELLFDEIYDLANECSWFDTGRFVDDVYAKFQDRGYITDNQRVALSNIRDMLEERS